MIVSGRAMARILSKSMNKQKITSIALFSQSVFNENILSSNISDVEIPKITVPEYIFSKSSNYGKFTAIECGITGRKYTYDEIRKKSENFAKGLRKKFKLKEGDVVGVLLPNVPEYPIVTLGVMQAGLIMTTINPIYTADEIKRQLKDSSTKVLITLNSLWNVAFESVKSIQQNVHMFTIRTEANEAKPQAAIDFLQFIEERVDCPVLMPRKHGDVALLPYSSGTTGLPKGVQLTHHNIVSNLQQNSAPEFEIFQNTTESHQDVLPALLPLFHIYGQVVTCLLSLSYGCKNITLPKFTPDLYVRILKDYKPDILFAVPPIVHFMTASPLVKREYLANTRLILSGAAPLGALDEQRFLEKCGDHIDVLQGYGLTETSPTVSATTVRLKREKGATGSIGIPVPNTLAKIVAANDPTGVPLGPNRAGELLVRGPQVMKGYLNRPEETRNAFLDGWFRTGDMVYYNDDRIMYITDRLKELIKVKGFQVAPAELEEIIRNYPNVADAAVIGIDHPLWGEVPRAYVVPRSGFQLDGDRLKEHVEKKVAPYKKLEGGVAFVDSIPKNMSGKIMRRQLKQEYNRLNNL